MAIAGKVAIVPRGEYQDGATYQRLDYVRYKDNTYVCKKECTNIPPTDEEYFMLATEGAKLSGSDTSDVTTTFAEAKVRENIKSGEKQGVLFGKIAKWFNDLKTVAFSNSYNDIDDKPSINGTTLNGNLEIANTDNNYTDADKKSVESIFNRYYGLIATTTEFKPDGSIVVTNDEATIMTTFATVGDTKTITEKIVVNKTGKTYTKTTTITPASGSNNKKITEVYE